MPAGDIETYHADGKWRNRVETLEDLPGEYVRKDEAVRIGATKPESGRSSTSSATSTAPSPNATPTATTPATSPAEHVPQWANQRLARA